MTIGLIGVLIIFWLGTSLYVMDWLHQQNDLNFSTAIITLLLGPILSILVRDSERERKSIEKTEREDFIDRYRRWFQLYDEINRQRIPPPRKNNSKDFKMLRGYDKN